MSTISPRELSERRSGAGPDPYVLDVRPPVDFEDWHVPGSVNLDLADALRADPESARPALASVPRDREVVVVRAAGEPAETAASLLREMGHDVRTLACRRP